MECPRCHAELARREFESVVVDECPGCGGIWFDRDELRQAKDAAEPDANWLDFDAWTDGDGASGAPSAIACPSCDGQMVTLAYGATGVEIDVCGGCHGTWLDRGEFAKIVDALSREIVAKSVPDYLRSVAEEAKELLTGPETLWSEWKDFTTVLRLLQVRLLTEHPTIENVIAKVQGSSPLR
jgi:Zn-finger nucleic acid-binding protein